MRVFCVIGTVLLIAAMAGSPEVAIADPTGQIAFVPQTHSEARTCSTAPPGSDYSKDNGHVGRVDVALLRSWISCFRDEVSDLSKSAATSSGIPTETAVRLQQIALQADALSEFTENYVADASSDSISAMSALRSSSSAFAVKAADLTAKTAKVSTDATGAINTCKIINAITSGAGTVTAAAANSNSGGNKVTFAIINAGLGAVGQIICNSKSTNDAQNDAAVAQQATTDAAAAVKTASDNANAALQAEKAALK